MKRLGTALHISRSGNIIVKSSLRDPPPLGSRVFDRNMKRLGVVVDVIGPVEAPYIVVRPESSEIKLVFEPGVVYFAPPRRERRGRKRRFSSKKRRKTYRR